MRLIPCVAYLYATHCMQLAQRQPLVQGQLVINVSFIFTVMAKLLQLVFTWSAWRGVNANGILSTFVQRHGSGWPPTFSVMTSCGGSLFHCVAGTWSVCQARPGSYPTQCNFSRLNTLFGWLAVLFHTLNPSALATAQPRHCEMQHLSSQESM
jgi:hypothetical protein